MERDDEDSRSDRIRPKSDIDRRVESSDDKYSQDSTVRLLGSLRERRLSQPLADAQQQSAAGSSQRFSEEILSDGISLSSKRWPVPVPELGRHILAPIYPASSTAAPFATYVQQASKVHQSVPAPSFLNIMTNPSYPGVLQQLFAQNPVQQPQIQQRPIQQSSVIFSSYPQQAVQQSVPYLPPAVAPRPVAQNIYQPQEQKVVWTNPPAYTPPPATTTTTTHFPSCVPRPGHPGPRGPPGPRMFTFSLSFLIVHRREQN